MKYEELVQKVKNLPYFDESSLGQKHLQSLRNQLSRWTGQRKIVRLKKGLYTLPAERQKRGLSPMFVSNILYPPSYVSLEFALNFYGLIPEKVEVVTAISTQKTKSFKNPLGTFSYRKVKTGLFFGYEKIKDEFGYSILLATPEKALLDKLYFSSKLTYDKSYFLENLRLQNFEDLNIKNLKAFSKRINLKKIDKILKILIRLIQKEKK